MVKKIGNFLRAHVKSLNAHVKLLRVHVTGIRCARKKFHHVPLGAP